MWAQIAWYVFTLVVSYALSPKPKTSEPPPGNFKAPQASANAPIPVLFGTRMLKQPNVVWWGDMRITPIRKKGGKK